MMRQQDTDVEQIVSAYTSTRMTIQQFESMVRQALMDAAGTQGDLYDKGFSAGYDEGFANGIEAGRAEAHP